MVNVGGNMVSVVGGAWQWRLWEVMWWMWLVVHRGGD